MAQQRNINPPSAAWGTFKALVGDVVGPMAVLGIAAQKITSSIAQSALNAQKLKEAITASAGAETLRKQFEGLGMSAAQASIKVAALAKVAAEGPFDLPSLGAAAKNLQVVGGAALNTSANLRKVADMAAAAGTPIDTMATAYAKLMASLKGGGGAEAAAQMAGLGAISAETAQKIADLTASGASFSEKMAVISSDLKQSAGAAKALDGTLAGLQAKLAALQSANALEIGDMFLEGEKAATRAQIAFEKLKGSIDKIASSQVAALSGAFNSLKESVAEFLSSSSSVAVIGTTLQAVFAAAAGVLAATIVALGGLAATLLRMGASAFTAAGGMNALSAATRAWTGLGMGALGGITAIITALILFGGRALQTARELDVLIQKNKELADAGNATSSKLEAKIPKVRGGTVEDKQVAMEEADASVAAAEERVSNAKKARAQEDQNDTGWNRIKTLDFFGVMANQRQISAEGEVGLAQNDLNRKKNARSEIASITRLGMSREDLQKQFARNDLTENIRNSAFDRLQASADPEAAARMASDELARATKKDDANQIASKASFEERQRINDSRGKVTTAEGAQAKDTALTELASLTTTTESGGLQKQIDYRKALVMEQGDVKSEGDAAQKELEARKKEKNAVIDKYSGNGVQYGEGKERLDAANAEIEAARKKVAEIDARKQNVAARSGGLDLSGEAIQKLEIERDAALKKEDPNKSTAEKEEARIKKQAADEAVAAQRRSIATQRERANLESNLAGLSDTGANEEFKIKAESDQQRTNDQRALVAAQNVAAKDAEYSAARGTPQEEQKRQELEAARTQAAEAGVNGRGVAEIQAQLDIQKQIVATKLQAAKVAEAGAKAEYDAAMRRLNVEQQISQLKIAQAKSKMDGSDFKGKTESKIKMEASEKELSTQEKALKASQARDAAEAAVNADPSEANKKSLDAANQAAAAAGVGNRRTRDVEGDVTAAKKDLADKNSQEAAVLSDTRDSLKIQSLRATENYGPGSQREAAKKEADALEDKKAKQARVAELGASGITDTDTANKIADIEVKRNRLTKDIQEQGNVPVSSMARIGGAAGFAGMVNTDQEKNRRLEELNKEQNKIISKMEQTMKDSYNLAVRLAGND
jgi:hypothetical protein